MRLIGVGMGPGDPDLVTVKAVRVLREADVVFVPVLDPGDEGRAETTVRAHAGHDRIERLVFALNERTDSARRERHWDAAGARVAEWLRETGGDAAFATIGDPNVYSTFTYLAQTVADLVPGLTVETVPGITAMQALAAAANVPLTEGSERLTLLPLAHGTDGLGDVLDTDGTVVIYKAGRHLADVAAALAGREAILGEHLGLPGERVGPVEGEAAAYLATVLVPAKRSGRGRKL